jgi:hypothetical protein
MGKKHLTPQPQEQDLEILSFSQAEKPRKTVHESVIPNVSL